MPKKKSEKFKVYDISLPLHQGMITYPGNPEFRIKSFPGATSCHSELSLGTHTGTHIDTPKHVFKGGKGLSAYPLTRLIGNCRVLNMTHVQDTIRVVDLKKARIQKGERILVKTKNSLKGFKNFYNDYIYLDGDAAEYLVQKKILLFGIDHLSIKQKGSLDTRPHTELLKHKVAIFEGLDLSKVKPGKYFFMGLPLSLGEVDGAPARAVLMSNY